MTDEATAPDPTADRLRALAEYLKGLYGLKRDTVRHAKRNAEYWLDERGLGTDTPGVALRPTSDEWLTIRRKPTPPEPEMPAEYRAVVFTALKPGTQPIVDQDRIDGPEAQRLADRVDAWVDAEWRPWAAERDRYERAHHLFGELNRIRQQVEENRDSLELVWGFQRLTWDDMQVDHPIIIVPAEIGYDPEDASLSVFADGTAAVDLECINGLPIAARETFAGIFAPLVDDDADVWQGLDDATLQTAANAISHDAGTGRGVRVSNDWCLYVRRRPSGYFEFLGSFEEHIATIASAPALGALVADDPQSVEPAHAELPPNGFLLPKAANAEQRRILEEAARGAGVTVEGPPGTGKSHTIANLVCALIAEGKRVLVTAEKEQALNVLYDKLPEPVRPLCVPALGNGQQERQRLVHSVEGISNVRARLAEVSPEQVEQMRARIAEIHTEREAASDTIRAHRVLDRSDPPATVRDIVATGVDDSDALDVARWIGERSAELGFIADPLPLDRPLPLSNADLADLQRLAQALDASDVSQAILTLPDPDALPDAAVLRAEDEAVAAIVADLDDLPEGCEPPNPPVLDEAGYERLASDLRAASDQLRAWADGWQATLLSAISDPPVRQHWAACRDRLIAERTQALHHRTALHGSRVVIPDAEPLSIAEVAAIAAAAERLRSGKRLGLGDRAARRALRRVTVDDLEPTTADHLQLVLDRVALGRCRSTLSNLLVDEGGALGIAPPASQRVEEDAGAVADDMSAILAWTTETAPSLNARCRDAGAVVPDNPSAAECATAAEVVRVLGQWHRLRMLTNKRRELERQLSEPSDDPSPLWGRYRSALRAGDLVAWTETAAEARRLRAISSDAARYDALRRSLASAAPRWTAEIVATRGAALHDPDLAGRAWEFRRVETWFDRAIGDDTAADASETLLRLRREEELLVGEIVAANAWARVAGRIDGPAQVALGQFTAANARLGLGKGKYAPRIRRQIREALDDCRHVVPVWIMTVERAFSDFRCAAEPPFDVIIVDEASQIPVTRVPVFGLAARVIVVGDDKQISPTSPGVNYEDAHRLERDHLAGVVPKHEVTFNLNASLYDVARVRFPRKVLLTEHFRCLPEIIGFSNARYYEDSLVPLRDRPPAPRWRQTYAIHVENGQRDADSCNRAEADYAAHLIAELIKRPEYEGMTFGVISLLASGQQARLLQDCIADRVGAVEVERREIRVGDAARFQGDERDVIIISMVVSAHDGERFGAFSGQRYQQMVNVAASRARNQLWVLHSAPAEAFAPGDERLALIRHCTSSHTADETFENLEQLIDHRSPFERDMLRALIDRGYRTIRPQFKVGRYQIDFVIEGPDGRLALECDGDRFHGPDEWEADRARQEVLERAGWRFVRVRGTTFYRHRDAALAPLWATLDEMGIPPGDWRDDAPELEVPVAPPTSEAGSPTRAWAPDDAPAEAELDHEVTEQGTKPTPPRPPDSKPTAPTPTPPEAGRRSWGGAFRNAGD